MTFISVTRLRIRSARFLPGFALRAFGSMRQVKAAPGFKGGSLLTDRRWTFWTMTAWDTQESMRGYMTDGAHRAAMPRLVGWCDEASGCHWDEPGEALPGWPEAARRMGETGRASKVRFPSPRHAALDYPPPRLSAAVSIHPVSPSAGPPS